jgi:hypothetical protein
MIKNNNLKDNIYLYECNKISDIENNINEVKIPEFTIENIKIIDKKYKKKISKVDNDIILLNNKLIFKNNFNMGEYKYKYKDKHNLNKTIKLFELNEIYNEYLYILEKLKFKTNKYNSLKINNFDNNYLLYKNVKLEIYFNEIVLLITEIENNIKLIL